MKVVLLFGIAATVMTGAQTCLAADKDGYFMTTGAPTCGQFIAGQKPGNDMVDIRTSSWMAGYVSAYNAWSPDTYDILRGNGIDGMKLWMTNYCNAHPLEDIAKGMEMLVQEQRPQREKLRPR